MSISSIVRAHVAAAALLIGVVASPAPAQKHAVIAVSSCSDPVTCIGDSPTCSARTVYADTFGDAYIFFESYDIIDPDGLARRWPAVGNHTGFELLGNAVALGPGGTFPVLIGPPNSTYESPSFPGLPLPGSPEAGTLRVLNEYVVQGDEPAPFPIETVFRYRDQCNEPSGGSCDPITLLTATTSSLITVAIPAVSITGAASPSFVCPGTPTPVTLTTTVSAESGNIGLANVVVTVEGCGPVSGPTGDDGDGVLDIAEPFADLNGSGAWEPGEPFIDENANGTWDAAEVWTFTCAATLDDGTVLTAEVEGEPAGENCSAMDTAAVQVSAACPDVDDDGDVDFADLLAVLTNWGPCPGCPADVNGDGVVGFADVLLVLTNWS